jgi:hypothetical protein
MAHPRGVKSDGTAEDEDAKSIYVGNWWFGSFA